MEEGLDTECWTMETGLWNTGRGIGVLDKITNSIRNKNTLIKVS